MESRQKRALQSYMRKSSFCSCPVGTGCGALGFSLIKKKLLKKLSTPGGKSGFSMCCKPSGFLVWGSRDGNRNSVWDAAGPIPCCSGVGKELPWSSLQRLGWRSGPRVLLGEANCRMCSPGRAGQQLFLPGRALALHSSARGELNAFPAQALLALTEL